MLARLDHDLAPLRSSVDREGVLLRVSGPNASLDLVARVIEIVEGMGYVAGPAESIPSVAQWFGPDDVDALSQEEAGVLAGRWIDELASESVIERPTRLSRPLTQWLLGAFRTAARTGEIDVPLIEEDALRAVLDEADTQTVRAWLRRKLGQPHLG